MENDNGICGGKSFEIEVLEPVDGNGSALAVVDTEDLAVKILKFNTI